MARIPKSLAPKLMKENIIYVYIPRKFLLKCFNADNVTLKDVAKIIRKNEEIEKNISQLRHVQSIVDKIILKHTEKRTYSLQI